MAAIFISFSLIPQVAGAVFGVLNGPWPSWFHYSSMFLTFSEHDYQHAQENPPFPLRYNRYAN